MSFMSKCRHHHLIQTFCVQYRTTLKSMRNQRNNDHSFWIMKVFTRDTASNCKHTKKVSMLSMVAIEPWAFRSILEPLALFWSLKVFFVAVVQFIRVALLLLMAIVIRIIYRHSFWSMGLIKHWQYPQTANELNLPAWLVMLLYLRHQKIKLFISH